MKNPKITDRLLFLWVICNKMELWSYHVGNPHINFPEHISIKTLKDSIERLLNSDPDLPWLSACRISLPESYAHQEVFAWWTVGVPDSADQKEESWVLTTPRGVTWVGKLLTSHSHLVLKFSKFLLSQSTNNFLASFTFMK